MRDTLLVGPAGNRFPRGLSCVWFTGGGVAYIVGSRGGGLKGGVKSTCFLTDVT